MIYQKLRVQFEKEEHIFILQKIESLSHLHELLRKSFTTLPHQYQIYLDSDPIQEMTYRVFWQMKTDNKKETKLIIFQGQSYIHGRQQIDRSVKVQLLQFQHQLPADAKMKKLEDIKNDIIMEKEIKKIIQKTQKLSIQNNQEKIKEKELIVNQDVQCDRCFSFPIKGKIYKCLICKDYDLCEACEGKNQHEFHPLLKITKKKYYPLKVDISFSKQSMKLMNNLQQQRQKSKMLALQNKKKKLSYFQVDPSSLKQTVIISKSFLSQMIDAPF